MARKHLGRLAAQGFLVLAGFIVLAFAAQWAVQLWGRWAQPAIAPGPLPGHELAQSVAPARATPLPAIDQGVYRGVSCLTPPHVSQGTIGEGLEAAWLAVPMVRENTHQIELLAILRGFHQYAFRINFSPDGRLMAVGSRGAATVFDVWSGHEALTWRDSQNRPISMRFSPGGRLLALGYWEAIELVEVASEFKVLILDNPKGWAPRLDFSPDGRFLAAQADRNAAKVWDVASGREVFMVEGADTPFNALGGLAFSRDGRVLATAHYNGTVRLWDVGTGRLLRTLTGHKGTTSTVAFSSDGRVLAVGSFAEVRLWDAQTWEPVRVLGGHKNTVWALAFSPDGRMLASGSEDWTVRLYDYELGCELRMLGHGGVVQGVAFSPDGRFLATGSREGIVRLWGIR